MKLMDVGDELAARLRRLRFGPPVAYVYNPLVYARESYLQYVTRYGKAPKRVVFVGMNPGPFGMAQTGVPFGEVSLVRDWLGIEAKVLRPRKQHPKRPVLGFECARSEVSGQRLWGWARDRFGTPAKFFRHFFVANYCPLLFLEASGRNLTPDRLPAASREKLYASCNAALRQTIELLRPRWVIGVGGFAEARAHECLDGLDVQIGRILHPSPASPIANRGWARQAEQGLKQLGLELP